MSPPHSLMLWMLVLIALLSVFHTGVATAAEARDSYNDLHFQVELRPAIDQPEWGLMSRENEPAAGRWIGLKLPRLFNSATWLGSQRSWPRDGHAIQSTNRPVDGNLSTVFRFHEGRIVPIASWNLFAIETTDFEFKPVISTPRVDGGAWFWVDVFHPNVLLIGFDYDGEEVGRSPAFTLAQLFNDPKPAQITKTPTPDATRRSIWMEIQPRINFCVVLGIICVFGAVMSIRSRGSSRRLNTDMLWWDGNARREGQYWESDEKSLARLV